MRAPDQDAGAAAVFTPAQRGLLLIGTALLMMLRLPFAWWHGRFLGEEGTIFFAYAWHRPAAEALLRSFGGYLNLAANAVTLATARLVEAGIVPLERAPLVTMASAAAFQLVPAALLLTALALAAAATNPLARHRRATRSLCALTVLTAAITFPQPIGELAHGPDWGTQVAAWRRDHGYQPASWPAMWRLDLSDGDRPCPPRAHGAAVAADPSCCESAWTARVMGLTAADMADQARDLGHR